MACSRLLRGPKSNILKWQDTLLKHGAWMSEFHLKKITLNLKF